MKPSFSIRRHFWILLGVLTLLIRWGLSFSPEFTERYYSRGLFLGIRWVLNLLFGWMPISGMWLLVTGLIVAWWWWRKRNRSISNAAPNRHVWLRWGHRLLSLAGGLLFAFYFLWGFNYHRIPVKEALGLELSPPSQQDLVDALYHAGASAAQTREAIPNLGPDTLGWEHLPLELEEKVNASLRQLLRQNGYPAPGQVRGRLARPGGLLLRLNVAGIYNPFTGEGNISRALMPVQIPFTMAHEMAHGYGFGDEGVCNFWALLACESSEDPLVRYSGWIAWWRYVGSELYRTDPDLYKSILSEQDPWFQADLTAIRNNSARYRGFLSRVGSQVNDAYLKAQGVDGGIDSYNQLVLLRLAYEKKLGSGGRPEPN